MLANQWQSVNGLWFFGFLMALIERVSKPLVVILDCESTTQEQQGNMQQENQQE